MAVVILGKVNMTLLSQGLIWPKQYAQKQTSKGLDLSILGLFCHF